MKRIMTAIVSLALLAGLASCQKEGTGKEIAKQTEDVEIVQVNLTASFLKTRVSYAETDANNLKPSWEAGDKIFCYDGKTFYPLTVGSLNADGSANISGDGPTSGTVALLYKNDLTEAPSLPLNIDYTNQSGGEAMPNVLFASGTITDGTGTFEFTSAGSVVGVSYAKSLAGKNIKSVKIEGTNLSGAEVTYASNAFTLTATANESDAITTDVLSGITAGSDGVFNNPVFIAVPVGATISKVTVTSTDDVTDTKDLSSSPKTVEANQYLYVKAPDAPEAPEDAINGLFSVSATKKVFFSKGNLQAEIDASGKPTSWKFAANQYDCLGEGGANKTIGATTGDVDLFGWSTDAASNNWGIHTKTSATDGFTTGNFKDWGTAIDNKGTWRTLSKDEWGYLLGMELSYGFYAPKTGHARAGKCGLATVNSVPGLVLLPDICELPSGCSFTATSLDGGCAVTDSKNFALNSYGAEQWLAMESAGVVFLPAAAYRNGSKVVNVGSAGSYWSSTAFDENEAHDLYFTSENVGPDGNSTRSRGFSVRLVSDCN